MARGVNKVILIGNVGGDPETRYLPNGNAVTNITLATTDSWKDKQTGQQQDRTEWHRVVFFGKLAEIAGEYLKKGGQCYIEGRLQTREWEKDGVKRYTTEIVVDMNGTLQLLGGRGGNSGDDAPRAQRPQREPQQAAPRQPAPASAQPAPDYDSFDDDIPFGPLPRRTLPDPVSTITSAWRPLLFKGPPANSAGTHHVQK